MSSIHLLVLIHGMWGNPKHLAEAARVARETHANPSADGTKLHLLVAEAVSENSTYDGVDWNGERVAKEVTETVAELESNGDHVVRFSVTGYSLGGLIARYCIGVLHQQSFFEKVEPVNFNTIATPHCGLPRYPSFFSSLTQALGPRMLSRTGEQFYCADKWSPKGRPLLVVMADPNRIFYQALAKFKHVRIYANAINDLTVPYVTAAIETSDPFADMDLNGIDIEFDEKYSCFVRNYSLPHTPPPKPETSSSWFRRSKPSKPSAPILPPFLQFRFPLNVVFYAMLPVIIPTLFSMILVHFALASRSSRARIKTLEQEAQKGNRQALIDLIAEIEKEMEEAVVELIDNPDPSPIYQPKVSKAHPIITPNHKKIAQWLNTLPLQKELAYFPAVRNSHAMIVSRDVDRFEAHRAGEPVLRHWATSLIL